MTQKQTRAGNEVIKKYYPIGGIKEVQKHLDSKQWSQKKIRKQIQILFPREWTEAEVEILKKYFPEGGSKLVLKHLKGKCSLDDIEAKAKELHLKYDIWSEEKIEILKEYYPVGGVKAVKEHLPEMSPAKIRQKAKKLNIKEIGNGYTKAEWTERELEILTWIFPTGGSRAVQERLPERSLIGIARRAEKLHIKKAWTEAEIAILKAFYPTEGKEVVKRLPDRTPGQCADMAKYKGYKPKPEKDLSFTAYLAKYGKTRADIKKLSQPLQNAWRKEYQSWQREEQKKLNPKKDKRTPEEIERDDCYELLADGGVPFGPDGEPLGIG